VKKLNRDEYVIDKFIRNSDKSMTLVNYGKIVSLDSDGSQVYTLRLFIDADNKEYSFNVTLGEKISNSQKTDLISNEWKIDKRYKNNVTVYPSEDWTFTDYGTGIYTDITDVKNNYKYMSWRWIDQETSVHFIDNYNILNTGTFRVWTINADSLEIKENNGSYTVFLSKSSVVSSKRTPEIIVERISGTDSVLCICKYLAMDYNWVLNGIPQSRVRTFKMPTPSASSKLKLTTNNVSTSEYDFKDLVYVVSDGLVAYYPFNGNANDLLGKSNGMIEGTLQPGIRDGNNPCYFFNGTNNAIVIPETNFESISNELTASFWMTAEKQTGPYGQLFFKSGSWQMEYFTENDSWFNLVPSLYDKKDSIKTMYSKVGSLLVNPGVWHHVVMRFKANTLWELYLDNQLVGSKTAPGPIYHNPDVTPLRFGVCKWIESNPGSIYSYFKGGLDDVRIYNRMLTTDEIKKLYDSKI